MFAGILRHVCAPLRAMNNDIRRSNALQCHTASPNPIYCSTDMAYSGQGFDLCKLLMNSVYRVRFPAAESLRNPRLLSEAAEQDCRYVG